MNNNQKIYTSLFLVFFIFGLRAQTVTTYFSFSQNTYPYGLATDSNGNFTFVNDSNWPPAINTINANGTIATFVSGNYYPPNDNMDDPAPTIMDYDTAGNLYFIDQMNWPPTIQKVSPDGTVSTFVNDDNYRPKSITCDNTGNLFFIDEMNWPNSICKVTADGSISLYVDGNGYNIREITSDNLGNIFFINESNGIRDIQKVTIDGTVTSFVSNSSYYIKSLTSDNLGNLYFLDQSNGPMSIKKVLPDGSVLDYVTNDPNLSYPNRMISDNHGNLFFIDYNNGRQKILTVTNPNYSCSPPSAPTATNTAICAGNTAFLTASGIGELRWYDAPTGGNLLTTENEYTTPILNSETTYYVEGFFCNSSSSRTPVSVSVLDPPVAVISGETTGNDFVTLTASGNGTYVWSAGYAPNQAVNYFTKSGTYSVTVTNAGGCSSTANVTVIVNKLGINKFGQLISDTTLQVNKNGTINASNYVNKHGKSASSVPNDGELNYAVFTAPASQPNNANEFTAYTKPNNQTTSGTYNASVLLNWVNASILTSAGIPIPNGGDRFAVQVSGFFIPEESGTYTFTCEGDDAVDLFIDGTNVANHYRGHGIGGLGTHTGTISLVEGTKYTFRARMQDKDGGEGLRVFWRKPSENSGWTIYTDELSSF